MKKVYTESVKKWGAGGIFIGTMVGLIFLYLSLSGAITITGYSGDQVCAGTIEDPCYAYINFTAEEDIFLYPTGYDPWGRNTTFEFSPGVKSWKLERSWGNGWREIDLNDTCKGTWCGAPYGEKSAAYSYAFREGRDYQVRITAYKNSPYDTIKWSVDYSNKTYLDPKWDGLNLTSAYNNKTKTITLNFLDNSKVAEVQLLTPINNHVGVGDDIKIAEYNITFYQNFNTQFFGNIDTYNKKLFDSGDRTNLNKKIILKYKSQEYYYEDTYYCLNETSLNGTNYTDCQVNGTELKQRDIWLDFNKNTKIKSGDSYVIGLFTDTYDGEYVEWIPYFGNFKGTMWASYLASDTVAYYNFDEASGDLIDQASTYDGTVVGVDYGATGIIGDAYDFESGDAGDYIQTGLPILTYADFSISVWIKIESYSSSARIINWRNSGNNNPIIELSPSNDKVFFRLRSNIGSGITTLYTATTLNTGTWYHLVATFDQSTGEQKLYLNAGTPTSVTYTGGAMTFDKAAIGGAWNLPTTSEFPNYGWYDGLIDEVAIFDKALNSTEVEFLYNSGSPGSEQQYPFEAEGVIDINYSVALPLGVIRFENCSPDWENADSRPIGQTSDIAAINATNNGTGTGDFLINLTGALNTGWTLFASNDSLINNITLNTTAQTIWSSVGAGETKEIWLKANCSYISSNPGQSISLWVK